MSQHDYIISNDTGANVRSDLNNALGAIASVNSGATEPSTTYAYQLWMDTTNNVLKIRNSANSAWYTLPISPVANNTVDINGGTIDGATIGGASAGAGTFSSLTATTADINGGTIDGATIGGSSAAAGTFTTVTSTSDSEFNGVDVGRGAGNVSTNTAVGASALDANTSGGFNVVVGQEALGANTTASNNTAVGYRSLYTNTTGTKNTIMGNDAGYGITTGGYNTCIGSDSGKQITTGSNNTIIGGFNGNQGGLDIRTSSNNIVLSDGDGNPRLVVNSNGDAVIGGVAAGYVSGTPAKLTLRTSTGLSGMAFQSGAADTDHWEAYATSSARFYIENNNTSNGAYLVYNSSGGWSAVSDERWKTDWSPLENASSKIMALSIGKYHMLNNSKEIIEDAKWDYGVKAQELLEVIPDAVDVPENPEDKYGVVPNIVFWHTVKALQEAMERIETLEAKVAALETP